jgi:hypothetical protein
MIVVRELYLTCGWESGNGYRVLSIVQRMHFSASGVDTSGALEIEIVKGHVPAAQEISPVKETKTQGGIRPTPW